MASEESTFITLKVMFQAGLSAQDYKVLRFDTSDNIRSVVMTICERSNIVFSGDFGLYLPPDNPNMGGSWLHEDRSLSSYSLENQTLIEFRCRPRTIKFLVDGTQTLVPLVVDYTAPVSAVIAQLCEQCKLKNPDDYVIQDVNYVLEASKSLRSQYTAEQSGNLILKKKAKLKDRKTLLRAFGGEVKVSTVFAATMFGVPIHQALLYSGPRAILPTAVSKSIEWIENNALDVEGIFRLSGSASEIESYKESFDRGLSFEFPENADPHAVAGLLKMYFRELPEPVIPFNLYNGFIEAFEIGGDHKDFRLKCFASLVSLLPPPNRILLNKLVGFLSLLVFHKEKNKMAAPNLAIVFAQNIFRDQDGGMASVVRDAAVLNSISKYLIENFETIFKTNDELPAVAIAREPIEPLAMGWLSARIGDFLFITSTANGFSTGYCHGQLGLFPEKCAEVMKVEIPVNISPMTPASERLSWQLDGIANIRQSSSFGLKSTQSIESPSTAPPVEETERKILTVLNAIKVKYDEKTQACARLESEIAELREQLRRESEAREKLERENAEMRDQLQKNAHP
eukprot:TRINITY_DN4682_c0_g1_i2.p1 TRINITY_DN4682_c0_g1~~TRINITY_DN4682_c0_g1_i2.p1  ORF type:complete len:569 (-),score=128.72 TRINITY_DN4682_c0_g1_i2:261-1967(-)